MKLKENNLITKSNYLIEAPYKLSASEQKVLLSLISLIKPEDKAFETYLFKVKDFAVMLDIKNKSIYNDIEKITDSLRKRELTIEKENSILKTSWLSSVEYFKRKGIVELCFDPKLKPYLLQLKERFTTYRFMNIIQLKSYYSIRIYELLKQYEKIKERVFEIKELRRILGIDEKQYPLYANFKQKVLKIAYDEINKKTDINFEFREIKIGKKVEKIKFKIISKKDCNDNDKIEKIKKEEINDGIIEDLKIKIKLDTLKNLIDYEITEKDMLSILDIANGSVGKIIEKYYIIKNKKDINNFVGLMINAIKDDYKEVKLRNDSVPKKAQTKFHNFEERFEKYSPKELEKIVLERQKEKFGI